MLSKLRYLSFPYQSLIAISFVVFVSVVSFLVVPLIGYKSVALLLLFAVSLLAMLFNIRAVLLSAILSALIWDFFFIPPLFTFSIVSTDDQLMVLMYFVVVFVNAVLTNKIKQIEEAKRDKQEKETSIKLYNTLLNSLSHELRTPIATIIAAIDNLQETKLNEHQKKELLSQISEASIRLNRQVENLLNMSRLNSGTLQLKKGWCDLNELIYESINHLIDLGIKHLVTVKVPDNFPMCKLDRGLILQVINNLLQNAYTYVPEKREILISAKTNESKLIIILEDNGNGFPEDEIKKVFDKFYRLKESRAGGTGLGLSIVKGYVEAHDGYIQLENKKTGGAMFTIEIVCEMQSIQNFENE